MANGAPGATPLLTRAKLLGAKDLKPSRIDVPEWDGALQIKRLSKADKIWVREQSLDSDGLLDPDLAAMYTIVRGTLKPQLEEDDVQALMTKSAYVLERIRDHIDGDLVAGAEPELGLLSRKALLEVDDLYQDTLDVPEWGGAVTIRVLSKADQVWVREQSLDSDGHIDEDRLDLLVIVKGIVEPALEVSDAEALTAKSADVVESVSSRILAFSATTRKAGTSAAAVEAAEERFLAGAA